MSTTRNITVSLTQAREWYCGDNAALKTLALQAFSESELNVPSIGEIIETLLSNCEYRKNITSVQHTQLIALKSRSCGHISAPKMLRVIAQYFNNGWKKTIGNTGYFFHQKTGYNAYSNGCGHVVNGLNIDWCITKHESVNYPGIVYFKCEKDCKVAFEMMKAMGKLENLYTDF